MASVNSRLEALETRAVRRRTQRRFKALKMPLNIVEFAMARRYLGEAIFPRQGTLLKLAAGQLDALTPYDHRVIAEWSAGFTRSLGSDNPSFVGSWGVQPDILDRIALMRERTGGGLEEFLAIIGRRGSKNFLGAILAADRLYRLCAIEDFTETFGIQRGKRLQIFVFAANRDQAIRNQLRDITNMVTHAPCFEGLVADASKGRLLLYTAAQRAARGDRLRPADALVEVLAAETTERAARGPASGGLRVSDHVGFVFLHHFPDVVRFAGNRIPWPDAGRLHGIHVRAGPGGHFGRTAGRTGGAISANERGHRADSVSA